MEAMAGLGAGGGEIPAASAGMTEIFGAGMTEGVRRRWRGWVLDTARYPRRSAGMTDLDLRGYGGALARV